MIMCIFIEKDVMTLYILLDHNLYIENVLTLKEDIINYLTNNKQIKSIIMDCDNIDYIDSYGLMILIYLKRRCIQRNGYFTLINVKNRLRSLFILSNLDKTFDVEYDIEWNSNE